MVHFDGTAHTTSVRFFVLRFQLIGRNILELACFGSPIQLGQTTSDRPMGSFFRSSVVCYANNCETNYQLAQPDPHVPFHPMTIYLLTCLR
jgi:hypothetical protein